MPAPAENPLPSEPWPALWVAVLGDALVLAAWQHEAWTEQPAMGVAGAGIALVATLWALFGYRRWSLQARRRQRDAQARAEVAETALREWREALDELPSGLEIYDPDDRLIFYNKRMAQLYPWIDFERQLGLPFESLLRTAIQDGRIPAAAGREEDWVRERLAKRGRGDTPMLQSLKNGMWINTYERRSRSNYVVGARLEVTDLVARTRELLESREHLQAIISSAAVGIMSVDADGRIVEANQAAQALFGSATTRLAGEPVTAMIPSLRLNPEVSAPAQGFDVDGRAADGRALRLHVSVSPIGEHGARQFVMVVTDVSERERAEAARRALETQLREAQKMESLGTLASGIAHDFNNVLGSIVGNADLARRDIEDGAAPHALQRLALVDRAAQRARNLVRQILTFSRRDKVQRTVQDLRGIVDEALKILRATLPAQVELDRSLADVPLPVDVDAIHIEQVVLNLCTNAWQALGDGGGHITVAADIHDIDEAEGARLGLPAGSYARLSVLDDGCGMDDSTRLKAFDPFFTTKPVGSGTGLGLSVVHGIVKSHEGAITVDSSPGQGSRFDVLLPLAAMPATGSLPGHPPVEMVQGRGERILYVDDDELMPLMVASLLGRAGYVVRCFTDPVHAIEAIRSAPGDFDLVVTDFNMPRLSGLDVARTIAALCPALPIVLTSGLVSDDLRTQAWTLGVREVLEKQNTLEELPATIHRVLAAQAPAGPRPLRDPWIDPAH